MTGVLEQTVITEPGFVDDLPEDVYHADAVPSGSLSYSGAKRLLETCPAKFAYERANGRPPKREWDLGHAAHRKLLGKGNDVVVAPFDAWRTNAAKAIRDEAYGAGKVPILEAEEADVNAMEAAVRAHPLAGPLFASGVAERSFFWIDEQTGLWMRGRADWMRLDGPGLPAIVDLKTCENASDEACAKATYNLSYCMQDDWYTSGAIACGAPTDLVFVDVFVEKAAPHLVNVATCDDTFRAYGRSENERARAIYADCTASGIWPGYGEEITYMSLPTWAERRFLEN